MLQCLHASDLRVVSPQCAMSCAEGSPRHAVAVEDAQGAGMGLQKALGHVSAQVTLHLAQVQAVAAAVQLATITSLKITAIKKQSVLVGHGRRILMILKARPVTSAYEKRPAAHLPITSDTSARKVWIIARSTSSSQTSVGVGYADDHPVSQTVSSTLDLVQVLLIAM